MKQKFDFRKYWRTFLHWKGWSAFVHWKGWSALAHWQGWQTLQKALKAPVCTPPFALIVSLFLASMSALVWVFVRHRETWFLSYFVYALSAYSLTALCVRFPSAIREIKAWLANHPKLASALKNEEWKFVQGLYYEQFINFFYGIFKVISGVLHGSAWTGADGIYNLAQAFIQLFQILRRKKPGTLEKQWRSYRFCGVLVLFMHLTMTGPIFQMVNWNRSDDQGQIMVIATAAFAFYKIISAFLDVAQDRKHAHPVDSSVRLLNLSQAIFSLFSLQVTMIHVFGTGEIWEKRLNFGSSCVTCLLVAAMGVYMIRRANREIRKIQEKNNGE